MQGPRTSFVDETAALNISAKACDSVAQYDTLLFGFVL